jgi:phenylalanine-4-hydroxylase
MHEELKDFTPEEHQTWRRMFEVQAGKRGAQVHPIFSDGLAKLGIGAEGVPKLRTVNERLEPLTGFRGVAVVGLEEDSSFFEMLSRRLFPIGNFIRDPGDLSYTPAPDVFHDLYGHLPFLADRAYADFSAELGRVAMKHRDQPESLEKLSRFFWFTSEFALVRTPAGKRIFGAGIASSIGECDFALSEEPEVLPFDVSKILGQSFKIDEFQRKLFKLESPAQLYSSLPEVERLLTT